MEYCHKAIWHWNVARAPNISEHLISIIIIIIIIIITTTTTTTTIIIMHLSCNAVNIFYLC